MRLDLGRTWTDAGRLLRADLDMVSAVAGMFILLPGILSGWLLPDRAPPRKGASLSAMLDANADYISAHWPTMLVSAVVVAFGSLALLALLVHRGRPTVRDALRLGVVALPGYLLANALQSLVVLAGLTLFILPGLYVVARFVCIAPAAAAEPLRNPLGLLGRSMMLTRGNGWRILFLMALVLMVGTIASSAALAVVGIGANLLLPVDVARLAMVSVEALAETVVAVLLLALSASIYRQAVAAR